MYLLWGDKIYTLQRYVYSGREILPNSYQLTKQKRINDWFKIISTIFGPNTENITSNLTYGDYKGNFAVLFINKLSKDATVLYNVALFAFFLIFVSPEKLPISCREMTLPVFGFRLSALPLTF